MQPTADFYTAAQACIERVIRDYRPKLLAAYGATDPSIKSDDTPVTEFDKELEGILRNALTAFDGSVGFEGEETGKTGNENTFWLVDPIDGTESFVRGLPFVRNMVTLINDNQPVFTFVYRPIDDELLIATKGGGAFMNGQPIHVSNRPLERTWVDLSASPLNTDVAGIMSAIEPRIRGFRSIGEFTYVAQGKVDAQLLIKAGGGPWDYAPRALLVSEAGGRVANIGMDTYDFRNNDVLMANSIVFDDLMELIVTALQ